MVDKVSKAQELLVKVYADDELKGRLKEATAEEIARIGAELGYDVDAADIREAMIGRRELSVDELEAAAGGIGCWNVCGDAALGQATFDKCGQVECIQAGLYDFV